MKKITTIILSVLLIALTFVSCDNATKAVQDELVEVTLSTQATGRSLTVSNPLEALSNIDWYYTAEKLTERQFNYGETSSQKYINLFGGSNENRLTLSQGKWKFELFGYAKQDTPPMNPAEGESVLYYGVVDEALILRDNGINQITVEVSPYTKSKGAIQLSDIVVNLNTPTTIDGEPKNAVAPNYLHVTGPGSCTHIDSSFTGTKTLSDLNAGQYEVTVAWKGTETGDNPYTTEVETDYEVVIASETIVVTVYGGRTTTISGNISEETGSGTINGNIEIKTEASQQKTVVADTPTTFTVNVAPANSVSSSRVENTTVTMSFDEDVSAGSATELFISVKNFNETFGNEQFEVTDNNSAVAGINLSLNVIDNEDNKTAVSSFNNVLIETYIVKGLSDVTVKYNKDADDTRTDLKLSYAIECSDDISSINEGYEGYYNPSTGKLVFSTTHFSEYYVVADEVVALNTTTNTAYGSLGDAFEAVNNNETLVILKNCETGASYTITNPLRFTASNVTLDLNNKTITVNNNFSFLINGDNAVVKNGSIVSARNENKETKINSYVLVVNNCSNVILENLTLTGGLSLGGDTTDTPDPGAAANAVVRNCNITSGDYYAVCSQQNSTAIIESGTYKINDKETSSQGVIQANFIGTDGPAGSIVVKGGDFTGTISSNNAEYLTIEGGTFSVDPTDFLADGKMAIFSDEMYHVVNDTRVKTEGALKAAIEVGGEVTLGADIQLTESLNISKDVTLNLGAYKITGKDKSAAINLKTNSSSVKVIVNATTGGIVASGSNGHCFEMPWYNNCSAELTINGGNYESLNGYFVDINASSSTPDTRKDKLIINGGEYTGDKIINANPANTEIVMTAGTLTGRNGGIIFGTKSTNAKFTMTGGIIKYESGSVITAQASGNTIDISGTAEVTGKLSLKNCTMNISGGTVNITGSNTDNRALMISAGTTLNISGSAQVQGNPLFNMNGGTINITGGSFKDKIVNGLNYGNISLQSVENLLTEGYQLSGPDANGWYQVVSTT